MSDDLRGGGLPTTLAAIDRDGALADALGRAISRRGFLRHSLLGAGVLTSALGLPALAAAADEASTQTDLLNYLLTLERLQADFFTEAEELGMLAGREQEAARVIGAVERAHVTALLERLGRKAVPSPSFDFRGTTESTSSFLKTAVAFEDLASAAIAGILPDIANEAVGVVASVHTTEAQHAGWIRTLAGTDPSPNAIEDTLTLGQTMKIVDGTGFITTAPTTTATGRPSFTG
jgi:hypothetical protein